jgi:hypothetical protein
MLAHALPLAVAAVLLALLARIWAVRASYPYDLEWMEGGMLVHAWRLQHGLPLYPPPGPDFIPFIYPPGYPALLAALGSVFGLGAPLGRAVSLVSTGLACGALGFVVERRTGSRVAAVLGAAVFLGCYADTGAFYDLVRNDALFVALLGWSIALATEPRKGCVEASGTLLCAAFLVKHNAAAFGVPLVLGIGLRDGWRAAARFAAASAVPALLVTGYLEWRTGDRFLTYLLAVPAAHPFVRQRAVPGTEWELGGALPIALVGILVAGLLDLARRKHNVEFPVAVLMISGLAGLLCSEGFVFSEVAGIGRFGHVLSAVPFAAIAAAVMLLIFEVGELAGPRRPGVLFGALLLGTGLVTAASMRGHHGGFLNVHMHLFWLVALAFGVAMGRLASAGLPASIAASLLFTLQLAWSLHDLKPDKLMPNPADRAANDAIVEQLRDLPDPVLSPFAPWLPVLAGHDPGFHLIALWDVEQHKRTPFPQVGPAVRRAMREHHWGAVVDAQPTMGYDLNKFYRVDHELPGPASAGAPRTGWRARPRRILVPMEP